MKRSRSALHVNAEMAEFLRPMFPGMDIRVSDSVKRTNNIGPDYVIFDECSEWDKETINRIIGGKKMTETREVLASVQVLCREMEQYLNEKDKWGKVDRQFEYTLWKSVKLFLAEIDELKDAIDADIEKRRAKEDAEE